MIRYLSLVSLLVLTSCTTEHIAGESHGESIGSCMVLSSGDSLEAMCPDGNVHPLSDFSNLKDAKNVMLCQGDEHSFAEFGVCMQNKLYSMYWDGKTSWLAYLSPGTYKSTATYLDCDFKVIKDCEVSTGEQRKAH